MSRVAEPGLTDQLLKTIIVKENVANAYRAAGRLDEAITLYNEVIATAVPLLGPGSPSTLTARSNLAGAYREAGRLADAIALYEESFADTTRILGPDDPDSLT